MQFAWSPSSKALREAVRQAWALDKQAGRPWWALVDGAMLESAALGQLERKFGMRPLRVLEGTRMRDFGDQGPLLFEVPEATATPLDALMRMCNATPALSLMVPRADITLVQQALRWLALASTTDGTDLHCRFADTRVTPSLLDALRPQQRASVACAIACWYWPHRQGEELDKRMFTPREEAHQAPMFDAPFDLNDQQYAQMLHTAEADMVFQLMMDRMPDMRPEQPGGDIHARIEHMLLAAHAHGLEDLPDLFQYAMLGLSTRDDFDRHPALAGLWSTLDPNVQRFSEWVQTWPDHVWHALDDREQIHV